MKRIYLDNSATTPVDSRVKNAMARFWDKDFGNPSSLHQEGRIAKEAVEKARQKIANIIGGKKDEIIFTSGGTESDNLAILGVCKNIGHIITTKIEHPAVLNTYKFLEKNGFKITYIGVDKNGIVNPNNIKNVLRSDTVLVSVIYANNEIGTIQPIAEISKVIRNFRKQKLKTGEKTPLFHTDACQAAGYLDLNVNKLGVDLMTVNGSKIYGPKGVGFLYARKGIEIAPLIHGGGQENKKRAGTENVPAIIGLAEALTISNGTKKEESKRLISLRDYFIKRLAREITNVFLNGHSDKRLPNNINISILGVEGEAVMLYLDEKGIACSTGSACSSESLEPSHVIMALGKGYEYGHGSLRFTMGRSTKKSDIDYVMKVLPGIVKKLRSFSAIK